MQPYFKNKYGTLYHGDCVEVMQQLPKSCVKLCVTSPPYDNLRKYNGYAFDFPNTAKNLTKVLDECGIIVWVVNDATIAGSESCTSFKQAIYFKEECGLNLHDTMIWVKPNPIPRTHKRYEQAFEYMFIFCKGKPIVWNPIMEPCKYAGKPRSGTIQQDASGVRNKKHIGGVYANMKQTKNVWECVPQGHKEHPAVFPLNLVQDHITSWSNVDDIVFDPFMGSGTVAVAAETLNRRWIGCEISEKYCEIIANRMEQQRHGLIQQTPCEKIGLW